VVAVNLVDYVLKQFGYERLTSADYELAIETPGCDNNLVSYIIIEKIKFEDFRDQVYERAVSNLPKMCSIQKAICGLLFWVDQGLEAGRGQIIKANTNIHTEEDALKRVEDLCNEHMDYSKPLWEFYLQEDYSETESLFCLRFHHSLCDATGFIGMMSMVNDEKFKFKSAKQFPKLNMLQHIFFSIFGPFYSMYLLSKWDNHKKSDENAKKCGELNGPITYRNKLHVSKSKIPFEKIRDCYKRFAEKTTFNDYMMGVISVSFNKWFKSYNIEGAKNLKTMLTVNMRPLPTCMEEVDLANSV
jgi:hypothetical protein